MPISRLLQLSLLLKLLATSIHNFCTMSITNIKQDFIKRIRSSSTGNRIYTSLWNIKNGKIVIDLGFPGTINFETSSVCNLKCIHCPGHGTKLNQVKHQMGFIEYTLFERLMNEVDTHGKREISLHKHGEPLLHPEIIRIVKRVKHNVNHKVYFTTNGNRLTKEVSRVLLENKIDIINISLGAISPEIYKKVRGGDISIVIQNIKHLLEQIKSSDFKPRIIVQIVNLEDYNLSDEIKKFKKFWKSEDLEVLVCDELTWGIFPSKKGLDYRYPCYSLWDTFNINSDGTVSACCIDWNRSLIIGDTNLNSIESIWKNKGISCIRNYHKSSSFSKIPLCQNCNFWQWKPLLNNY
jgi:MoaA/NifB/PqqE/SkfB family radical SAM enzyme